MARAQNCAIVLSRCALPAVAVPATEPGPELAAVGAESGATSKSDTEPDSGTDYQW